MSTSICDTPNVEESICSANQLTGFYMTPTLKINELTSEVLKLAKLLLVISTTNPFIVRSFSVMKGNRSFLRRTVNTLNHCIILYDYCKNRTSPVKIVKKDFVVRISST